jgi:hypothetical protein
MHVRKIDICVQSSIVETERSMVIMTTMSSGHEIARSFYDWSFVGMVLSFVGLACAVGKVAVQFCG